MCIRDSRDSSGFPGFPKVSRRFPADRDQSAKLSLGVRGIRGRTSIQKYAVSLSAVAGLRSRPPCCRLRKTDDFVRAVGKIDILGLLAASDEPPGAPDGLPPGAPDGPPDGPPGAPDGPPDGPPGAQVGLWTGFLTPQTASNGPSPADKFTYRQAHLPTSPPADKSALAPSEPSTPTLFCRSRCIAVTA